MKAEMKPNLFKRVYVCAVVIFLFLLCLLVMIIGSEEPNPIKTDEPIQIVGEYSYDRKVWNKIPNDTSFAAGAEGVYLRGHLSREVELNSFIFFRLDNISASFFVNGECLMEFGQKGSYPEFFRVPGHSYKMVSSPGISEKDLVELKLFTTDGNTSLNRIEKALGGMSVGEGFEPYERLLKEEWFPVAVGFLIVFIGVYTAIIAFVYKVEPAHEAQRAYAFAAFAVSGGLYIVFDTCYPYLPLVVSNPLMCNLLDLAPLFLMCISACEYIRANLTTWLRRYIGYMNVGVVAVGIYVVLMQLFGIWDLYRGQVIMTLPTFFSCGAGFAALFYECFKFGSRNAGRVIIISTPLVIILPLEILNMILNFMPERVGIRFAIGFTIILQTFELIRIKKKQDEQVQASQRMKEELMQSKISVMLSQIQPHFLYNALNTIRYLCDEKPKEAALAVDSFAKYLRGNMNSLSENKLIPISDELEHLENYLAIERLRFPDISFIYDLKFKDFSIPALTIQPMVENAINHGVLGKEFGGTVKVSSWHGETANYVKVEDDGIGFDTENKKNDGRIHVGIENTKNRLDGMCGGSLTIKSVIGKGTEVVISIPVNEKGEN